MSGNVDSLIPASALMKKGKKVTYAQVFPAKHERLFAERLQRADKVLQGMKDFTLADLMDMQRLNASRFRLADTGFKMSKAGWLDFQACMDATTIMVMGGTNLKQTKP